MDNNLQNIVDEILEENKYEGTEIGLLIYKATKNSIYSSAQISDAMLERKKNKKESLNDKKKDYMSFFPEPKNIFLFSDGDVAFTKGTKRHYD